jgi:hypothetical protein
LHDLTLAPDAKERHLEEGLRAHIREFLLEMGAGFAFLGTQFPVTVGDREYYLDLLFYHVRLRCYVVVDLKVRDFEPEFAGKMNFYLSAVDDMLRHEGDAPSIGIILCKGRDRVTVEYALRRNASPIGVAEYLVMESLPDGMQDSLPTEAADRMSAG